MRTRATETVTVLRGTETNEFGDEVDSETAVHTGVLIAITESTKRTYLPAEGATRVIRSYRGLTSANADIQKGDRLRSEFTNRTYLVTELSDPEAPCVVYAPDLTMDLSRTS